MSTFFSIIIPTFNSEKTIKVAIESILSQIYSSFEIIIVDGNSTDKTIDIITSYSDRRIRYTSEDDDGIYDAMNKGVKMAKGEWLYFLGSDDSLFEDMVLYKINEAVTTNPKTKFIYGDVYTSRNYIRRYNNYSYIQLLKTSICHQSIFYHYSLFQDVNYDTKYKICADWDFNLKVFNRKNRPLYIDQVIARFNMLGVSNEWFRSEEYLLHFSDQKELISKYKGRYFLLIYYFQLVMQKIKSRYIFLKNVIVLKEPSV